MLLRFSMLFCGRNRPAESIPGQILNDACSECHSPPTQEILLVRQDHVTQDIEDCYSNHANYEQQDGLHEEHREQQRQRDVVDDDDFHEETQSTFSEVTLDARLIPEHIWDELPNDLQQQLSWDKIVPPQVTPLETLCEMRSCCCICTGDDIQPHEMAFINSCQHAFCFQCIDTWAAYENTCPLCKLRFQTITIMGQQPKYVPTRKQPSSNNILAPFEARSTSSPASDRSVLSDDDLLVAQVYANLDGLSLPASINAQDEDSAASFEIDQVRQTSSFDFS